MSGLVGNKIKKKESLPLKHAKPTIETYLG